MKKEEIVVLIIREYNLDDIFVVAKIFYDTVHTVNAKDYTKKQLDVWATGHVDLDAWNRSFLEHDTLIAEIDGKTVGFADIDKTGFVDRIFVDRDFQGMGIATALLSELEHRAQENGAISFRTYSSITAKPFFEKQGYVVEAENKAIRSGIVLLNFKMRKM